MSQTTYLYPTRGGGYYAPPDSTEKTEEAPHEFDETSRRAERESGRAEETARVLEPRSEADTAPYAYGPPAIAPRESNYISDDNLLLWLAEKQNGLYGDLRELMDTSKARSKLMEDLSHIKERLDRQESAPEDLRAEMELLLSSYAGSPFEAELEELFRPMLDELEIALTLERGYSPVPLSDQQAEDFSKTIESKIDALGRDDQLALIQIQSLTSDINQAAQLASNLLSSSNQTENTIVGNIGR